MKLIRTIYKRLDRLAAQMWFRVSASVIAVAVLFGVFGHLVLVSRSLDSQRTRLVEVLTGLNIAEGDEEALEIRDHFRITVDGVSYGDRETFLRIAPIFSVSGVLQEPRAVAEVLLAPKQPDYAPDWLIDQPGTTLMLGFVTTGWMLLVIWIGLFAPFVTTLLGTLAAVGLAFLFRSSDAMWLFGGFGTLIFTYVMLTKLVLIVLDRPRQLLAVAHTTVREASRVRLSLVFIVILLVTLPLIPLWLDVDQPLRFRVQTFISRSISLTFVIAGLLTLFLSVSTVAFEIRDRQIWQLVTKPMSRLNYMLGKWLGVMMVNLIVLLVAGVSIFTYTQYLRSQPVAPGLTGQLDALQVRDGILTARKSAKPTYRTLTPEQLRDAVDDVINNDTELSQMAEIPPARRRAIREKIIEDVQLAQRIIRPNGDSRDYLFEGLEDARRHDAALMLKYQFFIMESSTHETFRAGFMFNGNPNTMITRTYVPTTTHEIIVSPTLVRDDGSLEVQIANLYSAPDSSPYGQLLFEDDGLEIFYTVGGFEMNFVKASLVSWLKLSFLAMLGIGFATFLSFSVALLAAFTIFIIGSAAPFLSISLAQYQVIPTSFVDWGDMGMVLRWGFGNVVKGIGTAFVFMLRGYSEISPKASLVEGRHIAWSAVMMSVFKIGVLWSGLTLLIGYAVMRKRELATYSGQG